MNFEQHGALTARFGKIVNLNRAYVRLRRVKSDEETRLVPHRRLAVSDRGMAALRDGLARARPSASSATSVERAYVRARRHQRHPLHRRDVDARPAARRAAAVSVDAHACANGDVVFAEISAAFWDQSGQVLRSFTVGEEPTPLYRDLHAAADAAFDAIAGVLQARRDAGAGDRGLGVIEDAGFTIIDDLLHGYGGGYLPADPRLQEPAGRPACPEEPFEAGQTVVIQPNVVTRDGKAGVQTGEMRADHGERDRAAAFVSARLRAGMRV